MQKRLVAEISCIACARDLGQVERAEGKVRYIAPPESGNTAAVAPGKGRGLFCSRCGGKALIGPLERAIAYAA